MTGGQGMPGRRGAVAAALAIFFALAISPSLGAKGETTKIAISGADLTSPIAITDPVILRQFNVWSGAGTFRALGGLENKVEGTEGFIIDWSSGVAAERPAGLQRYEVAFYAGGSLPVYTVFYEIDVSNDRGYVYLPGPADELYTVNTWAILRGHGFEGHWLRANLAWQQTVGRILLKTQ
jgi:hypothetical protein